jgi:hypothetical protein
MNGFFAGMRRSGFGSGISSDRLAKAMVEVLLQLPPEPTPTKELVVHHLGLVGQMATTRELNAAWNAAKRLAARDHSDKFGLDGNVLRPASAIPDRPRGKLSTAGQRKLAALADKEQVMPDEMLGRLIAAWRSKKE